MFRELFKITMDQIQQFKPSSMSTFLIFAVPLSFSSTPQSVTLLHAGENITLECNITGYPHPVITWYKVSSTEGLGMILFLVFFAITNHPGYKYVLLPKCLQIAVTIKIAVQRRERGKDMAKWNINDKTADA